MIASHDSRRTTMTLPYLEPLELRPPAEPVIPEPPRRGDPGGEECGPCAMEETSALWADDNWRMFSPRQIALLGAVWLASRVHVDSFIDLPPECATTFGHAVASVV
jgi:hypothetical protein